ncbi:MAG: N-formylglutamate amidohydrolase [Bauldia sp.]
MAKPTDFDPATAFEIVAPARQTVPFVLNSPHSGSCYPASFLAASRLDAATIRRSEDSFVDELILPAAELGMPLLRAHFPRAWLDVNREPFELDPRMFSGALPSYANIRSARVTGGLGTIARVVADSEEIYARPLAVEEALERIETVYLPYHDALTRLVDETDARFGCCVLLDCHSMPSTVRVPNQRTRPDIVLGDRHGTSCAPRLVGTAEAILTRLGYDVARNRPYAGGYITEHYGRPADGIHALQIEINRALYLNERTLERTAGFDRLSANLAVFAKLLVEASGSWLMPQAEAAE